MRTRTDNRLRHRHHHDHGHPRAPRSDNVLRNLAFLALSFALLLSFLNLFLDLAILLVGMLAPAWHTFKALEHQQANLTLHDSATVQVLEQDQPDNPDSTTTSEDDENDQDWIPSHLRTRTNSTQNLTPSPQPQPQPQFQPSNDLRNWQMYWILSALLFVLDAFLRPILPLPRPLYSATLFSALTWLSRNRAANAAALYATLVRPVFLKSHRRIDTTVADLMRTVDRVTAHLVLAVNQVVEPVAKQLHDAAERTGRHLEYAAGENTRQWRRRLQHNHNPRGTLAQSQSRRRRDGARDRDGW